MRIATERLNFSLSFSINGRDVQMCRITRKELESKRLKIHDDHVEHETAICESKNIGKGTIIWHFAQVREDSIIGEFCSIGKDTYIDTKVKIGDNVRIQNFASIYHGVTIGSDVFIGPGVTFTNDKYPRSNNSGFSVCRTNVENGSSIGANSIIIGRHPEQGGELIIGKNSMVGAGSIVTKDVVPNTLVLGRPARFVRFVCDCGYPFDSNKPIRELKADFSHKCSKCGERIEIKKEDLDRILLDNIT